MAPDLQQTLLMRLSALPAVITACCLTLAPLSAGAGPLCIEAPSTEGELSVTRLNTNTPDGTFGATAKYTLDSGQKAEVRMWLDTNQEVGEVSFLVDGTLVSTTRIDPEPPGTPANHVVTSWAPGVDSETAAALVEVMHSELGRALAAGMVPQEFKCSDFGRKAVRVAKYLWAAASAAAGLACGVATGAVIPCGAAAAAATSMGSDAFEGYCGR